MALITVELSRVRTTRTCPAVDNVSLVSKSAKVVLAKITFNFLRFAVADSDHITSTIRRDLFAANVPAGISTISRLSSVVPAGTRSVIPPNSVCLTWAYLSPLAISLALSLPPFTIIFRSAIYTVIPNCPPSFSSLNFSFNADEFSFVVRLLFLMQIVAVLPPQSEHQAIVLVGNAAPSITSTWK